MKPKPNRLISRAAMMLLTVLMAFVGAQTAWADAVTLAVDGDIAEGTAGHYYVNMPTGDGNVLTISDSDIADGKGTFKFYDNGGKGGNYAPGNDYLVITAPEGYKINLAGSIAIKSDDDFGVWEGYDTNHFGTELLYFSNDSGRTPFAPEYSPINITSGGNSVIVWFASGSGLAGWDLTVTLEEIQMPDYGITVATATNGSVAASVGGTDATTAKESQTVTLTATPGEGYLLADLSVTCGGEAVELAWDVWTNSATFTMPDGDVTVTPTFTTKSDLFAIIPKTGTRTVTIPEGVTSFKVYDDGGPGGDYSPNCDGWLEINLPDGYHFHLSGSVTTDATSNDRLSIYKGGRNNERQRVGSDNAGVAKSFTFDSDAAILLRFLSNDANQYAGVDLTVTLVGASYSVTVNNADTSKGTVTASVGGESVTKATADQTVTLTASPAEGYVLGALSVRDADGKVVDLIDYMTESDMLWYTGNNTAVFTMPRSDVTVTPVFTNVMTADGGLTVNMPAMWRANTTTNTTEWKSRTKSVTIPSGVTSFKVYDYGGADCNYSDNYSGRLLLTAPEGCVLQLSGSITTQSGDADVLTAYDGNTDVSDYLLNHVSSTSDGVATAIPTVVSTVQKIEIDFSTDDSDNYAGLDLTVTVISPGTDYSVSVATAEGGTMEASTTTAQLGDVVTLTATPASGCVLSGLSVTCGGQAVQTNWNVWTNSATFKMPNGDVSVTPTFTSDLANFSVNLPTWGHKDATIPEGVASFKIYDDGGANGNYTPYCRGELGLTAPEGSLLRFTGSVAGPDDKFNLKVVDYLTNFSRNDIDVTSTNNKPGISFWYTVDSATGAGLDLTATVLYAVNVATGIAGGTVTPDKAHAAAGETVTLTVTPNADYTIGTVSINGQPLEADAGVYSFTMPAANVTVGNPFRKLLTHTDITVADIPSQTYDGTVLTPVVTITDANGGSAKTLTQNEDYSLSHESCQDAGDYTVTLTGIGNYDGTTTKTFTIARRSVTLTSGSETRPYDGTALTNNGVSVDGNGFAEGEGAIYDVTGSQTDAGSSANTFTYTLNTGTKAANYDIQKTEGTLTVTKLTGVTVTITGHTTTVTFDGEEHKVSGYEFASSSPLYTEVDCIFYGAAEASLTEAGTNYMGLEEGQFSNANANFDGVTFAVTDGYVTIAYYAAELADNADNTAAISEILSTYGGKADVKLTGRKLWKDGDWNTLTLPFDVVLEGSPFENAVARPLSAASIEGTTLNLTFGDAVTTLAAGVPYIIKWTKDEVNPTIDDPVFSGVTINAKDNSFDTERLTNQSSADYDKDFATDERVRFIGTYKSTTFTAEDKSILFLGTENKLYYPQPVIDNDNDANSKYPSIGAQRAYFKIGEDSSSARQLTAFNLSFDGDGTQNGIGHTEITEITEKAGAWYSLDGVRLDGKPTKRSAEGRLLPTGRKKGLYIHGGRKVVVP